MPREGCSHCGTESADGLTHIQTGHVDADGERAGFAFMPIGNERESRRDVECLTDTHQSSEHVELVETGSITHEIGNQRPDEETAHHQFLSADSISHDTSERAHDSIHPKEDSGKHLTIHIVEKSNHPEERYN